MRALPTFIYLAACIGLLAGCTRKTDDFKLDSVSDYIPTKVGSYITYRLDSTVFPNFGSTTAIHSYQEKHVIDAQVPDAMGRPSYRVLRYLRDTGGTKPWAPAGSYFITPLNNSVEVIENNLRFVRFVLPVRKDFTWKGNRFLPDDPYNTLYSFQNDFDIDEWDYTYAATGETLALKNHTLKDVVVMNGIDLRSNVPVSDANSYGFIDYMQDKYAKGIGLVYQEYIIWDYQPPNGTLPQGYKTGFGVKRAMIDYK